jgi:hypothetical protein
LQWYRQPFNKLHQLSSSAAAAVGVARIFNFNFIMGENTTRVLIHQRYTRVCMRMTMATITMNFMTGTTAVVVTVGTPTMMDFSNNNTTTTTTT